GRAQAFQALRDSEELHRATLSSISDAVFLTDDEGLFTFVCPNVDVIFGYVPRQGRGMTRISRLLGENLVDRTDLAATREVPAKTGERRSVLIHLKKASIRGSTVLSTCRDVTERRHAEEELRAARLDLAHVSRLALVGELIASIAHEITQPLTSILTNASAGLRRLPSDASLDDAADLREIFVDIGSQGRRAGESIERVRALAGKRPLERQALDMNAIAAEIVTLVQGEARRRGVTISTDLVATLPAIDADRVSLQQVMLNLMLNGMDGIEE